MIPFNVPPCVGTEYTYVRNAIDSRRISGDGVFTKKCSHWMEERFSAQKVLLTTSGSTALDMAAMLCDVRPGDEVILPSYTFSTTATAFCNMGAHLVFVDIRPDTMNIDERKVESAISERAKAIVVVHYAGVACEMNAILEIAHRHNLLVVEDAAQAVMSTYNGRALGTIGDFGCYSFHETKNYSMGEGGALLVNNPAYCDRAEIIREKGTDRSRFFRGQVDKYTWVDKGGSYLPSELNAAYLWGQLQASDEIQADRLHAWNVYDEALKPLEAVGRLELPTIPDGCAHNAHMYYIKMNNLEDRTAFISYLAERGINGVFHYVPLHSSLAGMRFGHFCGNDEYTTNESNRLVRLPMYYGLDKHDQECVIEAVLDYCES